MTVLSRFVAYTRMYPLVRGMISYAVIWPMSSLAQQTISGRNYTNYDYLQAMRFSLYGCFFTAPTLYCWIRVSSVAWPSTTFRTAISKALIEQITYGPAAMTCFFFGMTLLEGKGFTAAREQVSNKLLPTYQVGLCFWPILQTINFTFIKERNRVPFTSMCSFVWTTFLSYMHQRKSNELQAPAIGPQLQPPAIGAQLQIQQ